MRLNRTELVSMLHAQGDNTTADWVTAQLPAHIDTLRDADALAAVGLSPSRILAKLAAGSVWVGFKP
jgi:hypothetical protein